MGVLSVAWVPPLKPRHVADFEASHAQAPTRCCGTVGTSRRSGAAGLKGNTPLHECAYEGRAEGADMLLNRGAAAALEICNSMDKGGLTPLLAAIEYGHVGVVQVILPWCPRRSL